MKNIYIFVFLVTALVSADAHATGDPLVLYSLVGAGLIQTVFVVTFFILKIYSKYSLVIAAIYCLSSIPLWQWSLNYRGPDFFLMYIELYGILVGLYVGLYYVLSKTNKPQSNTE